MAHWLVKSEPADYTIEDLQRDGKTYWTGVRNYQARNNLRAMQKGDNVVVYRSMENPGVVGLAAVSRTAIADPTAEAGDWSAVELTFKKKFGEPVPTALLRSTKALQNMALFRQNRLSVIPMTEDEYVAILSLAEAM